MPIIRAVPIEPVDIDIPAAGRFHLLLFQHFADILIVHLVGPRNGSILLLVFLIAAENPQSRFIFAVYVEHAEISLIAEVVISDIERITAGGVHMGVAGFEQFVFEGHVSGSEGLGIVFDRLPDKGIGLRLQCFVFLTGGIIVGIGPDFREIIMLRIYRIYFPGYRFESSARFFHAVPVIAVQTGDIDKTGGPADMILQEDIIFFRRHVRVQAHFIVFLDIQAVSGGYQMSAIYLSDRDSGLLKGVIPNVHIVIEPLRVIVILIPEFPGDDRRMILVFFDIIEIGFALHIRTRIIPVVIIREPYDHLDVMPVSEVENIPCRRIIEPEGIYPGLFQRSEYVFRFIAKILNAGLGSLARIVNAGKRNGNALNGKFSVVEENGIVLYLYVVALRIRLRGFLP